MATIAQIARVRSAIEMRRNSPIVRTAEKGETMGWITDRKPEVFEDVLVTIEGGEVTVADYEIDDVFDMEEWIALDGSVYTTNRILAWQPLPEPYKGEEMLTCKERNYLLTVLKPFNARYIRKDRTSDGTREFITIGMEDTSFMIFPFFKTGEYYAGLENGRNYAIKEVFNSQGIC